MPPAGRDGFPRRPRALPVVVDGQFLVGVVVLVKRGGVHAQVVTLRRPMSQSSRLHAVKTETDHRALRQRRRRGRGCGRGGDDTVVHFPLMRSAVRSPAAVFPRTAHDVVGRSLTGYLILDTLTF